MSPLRNSLLLAAGVLLAAVAAYRHAWGLVALLVVGGAGFAWYRLRLVRSAAGEKFFGGTGEDTRLPSLQAAPSEMPAGQDPPASPRH